ncbi:MAG TPA: nuclear transport factor 2 family protein [Gemmatimonadales bacterium]|nr:nuclear transport factor 2 family protein [Gemmatimonadales bacterium]
MRTARAGLAAVLVLGCGAGRPSSAPSLAAPADSAALMAASEIMRLEEAWGRALSARDTMFFRETLGDDFVGTGGADVHSKAMVIEELAKGVGTVPAPRLEETQVRLFGEVAIVTGLAVYGGPDGRPSSRTRFTEVWIKRAGRWQAVHGHYNPVPQRGP